MLQIASFPIGSNGSAVVSESAGVLTISANLSEPTLGLSQSASVSVNSVQLVNAWAAETSNATLKAGLIELAAILAAIPV